MIHFNILQLWNHLYHIKRSVSRALIFFRICFLLKHRKKKTNFFFPDFKICRYSSLGDRSVGLLPLCALRQAAWPGSVNRRISPLFEVEGFLMEGKQWGMFRESFHFKTELWRWTVEEWPWDPPRPPTHIHTSLWLWVCALLSIGSLAHWAEPTDRSASQAGLASLTLQKSRVQQLCSAVPCGVKSGIQMATHSRCHLPLQLRTLPRVAVLVLSPGQLQPLWWWWWWWGGRGQLWLQKGFLSVLQYSGTWKIAFQNFNRLQNSVS